MAPDSSVTQALRELARRQGVEPTDEDLEVVVGFLNGILPSLAELESLLPPDVTP